MKPIFWNILGGLWTHQLYKKAKWLQLNLLWLWALTKNLPRPATTEVAKKKGPSKPTNFTQEVYPKFQAHDPQKFPAGNSEFLRGALKSKRWTQMKWTWKSKLFQVSGQFPNLVKLFDWVSPCHHEGPRYEWRLTPSHVVLTLRFPDVWPFTGSQLSPLKVSPPMLIDCTCQSSIMAAFWKMSRQRPVNLLQSNDLW